MVCDWIRITISFKSPGPFNLTAGWKILFLIAAATNLLFRLSHSDLIWCKRCKKPWSYLSWMICPISPKNISQVKPLHFWHAFSIRLHRKYPVIAHKPGEPGHLGGSYCSISLFSVLSKLYEGLLVPSLFNYQEQENLLSDEQFGFHWSQRCGEQLQLL